MSQHPNSESPSQPQFTSSFEKEAYVSQALELQGLSVAIEQLPSVVENFERVCTIAHPVLNFPLPDDLEAAPQFEP